MFCAKNSRSRAKLLLKRIATIGAGGIISPPPSRFFHIVNGPPKINQGGDYAPPPKKKKKHYYSPPTTKFLDLLTVLRLAKTTEALGSVI